MNLPDVSPAVSAVILNWNGGGIVCDTIASVLDLAPPLSGVIVVDNGSTDGSDVEIERRFPQVTLIRNGANLGFAAGNNVGIVHALENGADCVLLLNNDTRLEPSTVDVMVSALSADPHPGVVVPKIYYDSPGERQHKRIWAAGARWRAFPPRVTMRGYNELDRGQYDVPGPIDYATACALLIRRETVETTGLLDESYFMYQEDYAFCDQVRAGGLTLWYEPRAIVYHLVSASTGEGSPQKWRYWARSAVIFYAQHYDYQWWAILPLASFLLWVVARELVQGKVSWIGPFCQGVRAGWGDLLRMRGSRGDG
jgi:GT2 family glycosyltransferase